jgi:hypothetical protein
MAGELRPVTGRKRVSSERDRFSHSNGFDAALNNALAKTGWPKGVHRGVTVEFSATVEVQNPGRIVEYVVKLVPGG